MAFGFILWRAAAAAVAARAAVALAVAAVDVVLPLQCCARLHHQLCLSKHRKRGKVLPLTSHGAFYQPSSPLQQLVE